MTFGIPFACNLLKTNIYLPSKTIEQTSESNPSTQTDFKKVSCIYLN